MNRGVRLILRVFVAHVLCNITAAAHGFVYGALHVLPHISPELGVVLIRWNILITALSTVLPFTAVIVITAPVRAWFEDRRLGRDTSADRLEAAQRAVLELPLRLSLLALCIWIVSAALQFVVVPAEQIAVAIHTALTVLLIGGASFALELYLLEGHLRDTTFEVLGETAAARVPGVRSASIRLKLGLLLLTCCMLPLFAFTVSTVQGTITVTSTLYLGVSFALFGALQGSFIYGSIVRPAEALRQGIDQVAHGALDTSVPAQTADVLGRVSAGFNEMVAGLREGERIRTTFGRYVAPQVVEEILAGRVRMGGEERFATVLFTDIRGFTALSEQLPPSEVVRFLNDFLDRMVEVLVHHGATIDKFIGDSVMATFGVPVSRGEAEEARKAVTAAVEMVQTLEAWNRERVASGAPALQMGIGIHSGVVVAGNIGSSRKLEYTVIGDTVNTASRIEQLTKQLGATVLISDATFRLIDGAQAAYPLPPVEVKGKREPLQVYAVTAERDERAA